MGITIGFSKPKKWKLFAQLIMWGYNIPYSHVYIRLYSVSYQRHLIYQASHSMVNFMGVNVFNEENITTDEFRLDISDQNLKDMMAFAIDNAGKHYGIKQAIGMGIVRVAEIFGKYIKNPFADRAHTYVCSELCAHILKEFAGTSIPRDIDDITPKDVYVYLQAIKESTVNTTS
jgi:hypothetical protein